MGIGVRLADVREQQRWHPQQGRFRAAAGGSWGETELGEGATESCPNGVRAHYSTVGNELLQLALGTRKQAATNDYLPMIKTKEQGQRMLLAAKIATAVWDALGKGMSGQNSEKLVASAWLYLESKAFRHDLEVIGFFVDVDVFLDELRELTRA